MTNTNTAEYRVERSIDITAPAADVYAAIVDFHRWVEWSPWEEVDPNLARTYSGAPSGSGAVYEWSGNRKAGQGRMEITAADAPTGLEIALEFLKPFKATNVARFELRPAGDHTAVTWSMTGRKTFMTRVMGIFMSMDKMVGRDFEKGLAQLKTISER